MKYRPDIDGLRAVAVMAVVLHHLSSRFVPGGYIGVDVFFVISGYLITKIIHGEMAAGTFTFASFYERRVRRIFPALGAVIAVVLVVGWVAYLPSDYLATLRAAVGTVLFSANIVFWRDLQEGYFAADATQNPLLHMWSLGVEEQFYIVFPIALLLCMRLAKRWVVPILVLSALASLGLASALVGTKSVAVFFLSPFRAWEMLAGCLVAIAALPQPSSTRVRETFAWLALFAIVVPVFAYTTETEFPGLSALPPVLGAALLIHLGGAGRTSVSRLLSLRPAVFVGLISYSLYLWHWPVIVFAKYFLEVSSLRYWIPLLLAISFALACMSYRLIERPARRKSQALRPRGLFGFGIASMLAFVVIGAWGVFTNGFEARWREKSVAVDRVRTAPILFKACEARIARASQDFCVIGDASVPPDALLWGDSHMLAWLPGFDMAYRQKGRAAMVAPYSVCPPLVGLNNSVNLSCRDRNDMILAKLQAHPEIRQVVLGGFWSRYFADSNTRLSNDSGDIGNSVVAPVGLRETLAVLARENRDIVVLGPVPSYSHDVPLFVAREFTGHVSGELSDELAGALTLEDVRKINALFYETMAQIHLPNIRFIDVAKWMCPGACRVYDGEILYRDSNHLSGYGAMRYASNLADVISDVVPVEPPIASSAPSNQ